jgi:hypothetical protein
MIGIENHEKFRWNWKTLNENEIKALFIIKVINKMISTLNYSKLLFKLLFAESWDLMNLLKTKNGLNAL